MTTFKVGDKVRVTAGNSASSKLFDGRVCELKGVYSDHVILVEEKTERGYYGGLHLYEIELVSEGADKRFKLGRFYSDPEGRLYRQKEDGLYRLGWTGRNEDSEGFRTGVKELDDLVEFTPSPAVVRDEVETRTSEQIKMDTVREAGERRRQKALAHIAELENVIRRRNAEIENHRTENARLSARVVKLGGALDSIFDIATDAL